MQTYSVKYRKLGCFFWTRLKNVKGDALLKNDTGLSIRTFILSDESKIEIPAEQCEVVFSKERFMVIKMNMEQAAGTSIPIRG